MFYQFENDIILLNGSDRDAIFDSVSYPADYIGLLHRSGTIDKKTI